MTDGAAGDLDTLIKNVRVVDGTGNPWFMGDVGISRERIAYAEPAAGREAGMRARETVDGRGLVLSPGFIDIQSHSIVPLMIDPRSVSKVMQGVTTEIMGEAWTPAPFGERMDGERPLRDSPFRERLRDWEQRSRGWHRFGDWLAAMEEQGTSPNVGSFLGGGTLRRYVRGMEMGPASPTERSEMRKVAESAMEEGAFGVAYALIYPPDAYAETDELVEICRAVRRHGGLYVTHMRSEGDRLLEAINEAVTIGREAGVPVEIYHLKASGRRNWAKMERAIAAIDEARSQGVDVTAGMYPYTGAGTGLASVLPPSAAAGGKLYENLREETSRARLRQEVLNPSGDWEAMADLAGPAGVVPIDLQRPEHGSYVGRSLAEIAADRGQEWVDTAFDLLAAEEQRISTIYFTMSEENLALQLRQPWIKIATDAGGFDPGWARAGGPVHPRAYGTYPRVLGRYVREQHTISLEEAVRKMTSAVAGRLGLAGRGLIRTGFFADLVLFDAQTVADPATFEEPHRLATGIRDVWINGQRVVQGGQHTGTTPGRILRSGDA